MRLAENVAAAKRTHAAVSVIVLAVIVVVTLTLAAQDGIATNATVFYRGQFGNTTACPTNTLNCPKFRMWNAAGSGSWGIPRILPTSVSPVREAVIKYSPAAYKIVGITQSDDGNLTGYVCAQNCDNPTSWTVSRAVGQVWTTAPATHSRRFDVNFEQATGNAVVVYGTTSTNVSCDLAYKVLPFNVLNFSGIQPTCINDATEAADTNYTWVSLARDPINTSEEILLVGYDGINNDINAWVWNGTLWANQWALINNSPTTGTEQVAVAYASDGTEGMVIGTDAAATGNVNSSYWNGAQWTDVNVGDISNGTDTIKWLLLKADPNTDDLMAVSVSSTGALSTAYWDGTTWTKKTGLDTAIDSNAARPADFAWVHNSTGKLVWDTDTTGTTISAMSCKPKCDQAIRTYSTYPGTGAWLTLYTNPTPGDTVDFLAARLNSSFGIESFHWNGDTFTSYVGTHSNSTVVTTFEGYSIAFVLSTTQLDLSNPGVFNVSPQGATYTKNSIVNISANVTDNIAVSNVSANLTFPNGSLTIFNMSKVETASNMYEFNFTDTGQDGSYTLNIVANDTGGNINNTQAGSFTITPPPAQWNVTRYIFDNSSGALQATLTAGQTTSLDNSKAWKMVLRVVQTNSTATGNLSAAVNDVGLNATFNIIEDNLNIFDTPGPGVIDADTGDSGVFTNLTGASESRINFTGIVYPTTTHNASRGNFSYVDQIELNASKEFDENDASNGNNYTNIVLGTYARGRVNGGIGLPQMYASHLFRFKINETPADISNITVTINGTAGIVNGIGGLIDDWTVSIYNWTGGEWKQLWRNNTDAVVGEYEFRVMSNITIGSAADFVNSTTKTIAVRSVSNLNSGSTGTTSDALTDYIEIIVAGAGGTRLTWNPTSGTAMSGMDGNEEANFTYIFHPSSVAGTFDFNFSAEGGTNDASINNAITFSAAGGNPTVKDLTPANNTNFGRKATINFTVNVTDANGVSNVSLNVTFPNASFTIFNMSKVETASNMYEFNLTDTGQTGAYNFSIIANDTLNNINNSIHGNISVTSVVSITLPTSTVDFGNKAPTNKDDTTDNSPLPFTIQNDGNVAINVTVTGTPLYTGGSGNDTDYQFRCGDSGEFTCTSQSQLTFTPYNESTAKLAVFNLTPGDTVDLVELESSIVVPDDEVPGAKSSTVTITATEADTT